MDDAKQVRTVVISYARLPMLAMSVLFYFLGASLARFLGEVVNPAQFFGGMVIILLVFLFSGWIKGYYDTQEDMQNRLGLEAFSPKAFLLAKKLLWQGSLASLVVAAVLVVFMGVQRLLNVPGSTLLLLIFGISYIYSVPPLRLVYRGYGELATAVVLANLTPALSFTLQSGELHRLVGMVTFPLTALLLAFQLARSLESYASDMKYKRKTMMVALGWQRGMTLHNILVLGAYVLLGAAALFNLPWGITWPVLLTLPLALGLVWLMIRITNGAKPAWKLLTFMSASLLVLSTYLFTYSLWIG